MLTFLSPAGLDRFDRDVSIHFNATHAENVEPEEVASPLTPDQLAALGSLVRRCGQEEGHHQVSVGVLSPLVGFYA